MILLTNLFSMSRVKILPTVLLLLAVMNVIVSGTLVTFYIDHEVEQPLDYVEINVIIKAGGDSLEASIQEAANTIKSIDTLVEEYCKGYTGRDKQKDECKGLVDASAYSIKPQYEISHKKELFAGFVVAHELNIKVKQSDNFGKLVDDILKIGVNKINSLEWKPKEEADGEEFAVEEGIQQAQAICKKLGSSLSKIISAEEVTDFGEEPEEQEQGQDEEQQEEEQQQPLDINDNIVYYKFVVQCHRKK